MGPDRRAVLGRAATVVLAVIVVAGLFMGDARPEDRVATLGASIKCPVCQGEAIIDSPSPTAQAMMEVLEEKVAAGETNRQIFDYYRQRFGDGIVLDPPLEGKTLVVWLTPILGLIVGGLMISTRRRRPEQSSAEVS
ncbi:MAG: cytochrome c-type biogenesis protein CcmH [Acidimicrobiia bacterium]|nr:cytochrome c-type biogenesis protein CcmH [Acidimicrobiia bacterium]